MSLRRYHLVAISLVSTVVSALLFAKVAHAWNWPPPDCVGPQGAYLNATYGRCLNVTFFDGVASPVGSTIPGPLDDQFNYPNWIPFNRMDNWWLPTPCTNQAAITAAFNAGTLVPACNIDPNYDDVFINTIWNNMNRNYNCGPPADDPYPSCAATRRLAINSALVVATMLGEKGPSFQGANIVASYTNGLNWAKSPAVFNRWAALVRAYASAGLVDWNFQTFEFPGHINTTPGEASQDYVFFAYTDVAYPVANVRFRDSAGNSLWELNRACGNLVGNARGLPDFTLRAKLVVGAGDPIPGVDSLQPGITYNLDAWENTNGAPSTDPTVLEIQATSTAPGQPVTSMAQDLGSPIIYSPGGGGFTNNVMANGATAWHWWWKYHSFAPGHTENTSFKFQIPAGTPNGTTVCFQPIASPEHSTGGFYIGTQLCYEVQGPRYPEVVGQRGDVHAGGGLCGSASSAGNILGNLKGNSYGEYMVSSPGSVSSFASNGPAGNSLNVDGYLPACRPDLWAVAQKYIASGAPFAPASSPFSVAGKSGVYYYNGDVTIPAGTIDGKTTLVVNGSVTIAGIVQTEAVSRPREQLASLGIIASGNIIINPSATRVDAFLFSNGEIDTCVGAGSCSNILTVNGFMMAKSLLLGRLGTANSQGPQQAEVVALTPQLFLNPPVLFDSASVDNVNLDGQGENAPLF